ncbi:phage terminase large subunit [Vagococcus sp.]|uniref:phage terminase large subunit n=1 Tax=Vagococcus sp. TaxID=1933889 RepID=UPI003F99EBBC
MMMDKVAEYRLLKELKELEREKLLRNARDDFFSYCQLTVPEVYKNDRDYLKELCHEFEEFQKSDEDILLINVPPRHGKSLTAGRFVEWGLGNNPKLRFATGSYNEEMATDFSKEVRDMIVEERVTDDQIVYTDVFPNAKMKHGSSAAKRWALQGAKLSYLATSPNGSATGKGFDWLIIDDVIKGIQDATNELSLQKQWDWFTKQMLSRVEKGGKIVVIMTRWHSKDLAGRIIDEMPKVGYKLRIFKRKALLNEETNEMLCSGILSFEDYKKRVAAIGPSIANANYQQKPIDQEGRLYKSFKTYDVRSEYKKVWSYTDTADEGKDYLCSIVWGETHDGRIEVIDIIYTQKPMEYTEKAVANQFINNKVNHARIESNNGGRGFARNVREKIKGKSATAVVWFHQSDNKNSRIYSNSYWIEQNVYFPSDWSIRWPEYYESMTTYQAQGKNAHDDAQNAITGIAETMTKKKGGVSVWK